MLSKLILVQSNESTDEKGNDIFALGVEMKMITEILIWQDSNLHTPERLPALVPYL